MGKVCFPWWKEVSGLRTYEALYIVKPDLDDETIQTIAKKVESLVTEDGGTIVRSELWGRRRLAYEVKKFQEGYYILLRFTAKPTFVPRLENHFRLVEEIIRFLVVYFDDRMLRLEAEQARRKEEEARQSAEEARRREERDARILAAGGRLPMDDDDDDEEDDRY